MLALLCGGQGHVSAGMFGLVAEETQARQILALASDLLGADLRQLSSAAETDPLPNRQSQILSVAATLAVHACIMDALPDRFAVAGYSVGEMAAWSIAGVWPAPVALALVDARAGAMDDAGGSTGRLAYVRGLGGGLVAAIAARHRCDIAIRNPGLLHVLGGREADLVLCCGDLKAAGARRAELLAVRTAAHTPALAGAVEPYLRRLRECVAQEIANGRILFSGLDGSRVRNPTAALPGLANQLGKPLDWAETLGALCEAGMKRCLDLGPGNPLSDMVRAAFPQVETYSVHDFRSVDSLRRWLARGSCNAFCASVPTD